MQPDINREAGDDYGGIQDVEGGGEIAGKISPPTKALCISGQLSVSSCSFLVFWFLYFVLGRGFGKGERGG